MGRMSVGVCLRCGHRKPDYAGVCPTCGHMPYQQGLLVAWLLSEEHLSTEELAQTGERIQEGVVPQPTKEMLDRARQALGVHPEDDEGLSVPQRLGLMALALLITPAVGVVLWFSWRSVRPRAALQALWASLPTGLFAWAFIGWWAFTGWLR